MKVSFDIDARGAPWKSTRHWARHRAPRPRRSARSRIRSKWSGWLIASPRSAPPALARCRRIRTSMWKDPALHRHGFPAPSCFTSGPGCGAVTLIYNPDQVSSHGCVRRLTERAPNEAMSSPVELRSPLNSASSRCPISDSREAAMESGAALPRPALGRRRVRAAQRRRVGVRAESDLQKRRAGASIWTPSLPSAAALELARTVHKDPRPGPSWCCANRGALSARAGRPDVEHGWGSSCRTPGIESIERLSDPARRVSALLLLEDPGRQCQRACADRLRTLDAAADPGVGISAIFGRPWRVARWSWPSVPAGFAATARPAGPNGSLLASAARHRGGHADESLRPPPLMVQAAQARR